MSPLTSIPPAVRATLYWAGYLLGVLGQGVTIVWGSIAAASPEVTMPVWLVIASAVIGLLQTQLNLLAGSNLPSYVDVEGDIEPSPSVDSNPLRCTCSVDPLDRMPLVDGRCPVHGSPFPSTS